MGEEIRSSVRESFSESFKADVGSVVREEIAGINDSVTAMQTAIGPFKTITLSSLPRLSNSVPSKLLRLHSSLLRIVLCLLVSRGHEGPSWS